MIGHNSGGNISLLKWCAASRQYQFHVTKYPTVRSKWEDEFKLSHSVDRIVWFGEKLKVGEN